MDSEVMLGNSWLQLQFTILYDFPSLYLDFVLGLLASKYREISFSRSCATLLSCRTSPLSPCQHIHTVPDFQVFHPALSCVTRQLCVSRAAVSVSYVTTEQVKYS